MKPAANGQPHSSAYAASETRIVPVDANSFSFGRRKMTALNLASSARIPAPNADALRRSPGCGRCGSNAGCGSGGGASGAAIGAGGHDEVVALATDFRKG